MDISIFLIDPSNHGIPRDSARFQRLIDVILSTDIKEINLVSGRSPHYEATFLEKIPIKVFESKGLFNKLKPNKLLKRHISTDQFELGMLLDKLGKENKNVAFIYYEDDRNDLAYDGSDLIVKFLKMFYERKGLIVGMKKISFDEISKHDLIKGDFLSEGEYHIRSVFRVERALQASSNLALSRRFILNSPFFELLSQHIAVNEKTAFIESLDYWSRTKPVFGCLPFQPLKIK